MSALQLISPVDRRHLEAVVERLGSYHDRYARHLRRASSALERIERLRQSAIHALDSIDGDPDFESEEDDQCEDEGAFDGDNDTSDYEPSFCGIHMPASVGIGDDREVDHAP